MPRVRGHYRRTESGRTWVRAHDRRRPVRCGGLSPADRTISTRNKAPSAKLFEVLPLGLLVVIILAGMLTTQL